jgi:hypothetical protein
VSVDMYSALEDTKTGCCVVVVGFKFHTPERHDTQLPTPNRKTQRICIDVKNYILPKMEWTCPPQLIHPVATPLGIDLLMAFGLKLNTDEFVLNII